MLTPDQQTVRYWASRERQPRPLGRRARPAPRVLAHAGTKALLPETALGGPAMGFAERSPTTYQFVVAWTGTDGAHHLNIAVIGVRHLGRWEQLAEYCSDRYE